MPEIILYRVEIKVLSCCPQKSAAYPTKTSIRQTYG